MRKIASQTPVLLLLLMNLAVLPAWPQAIVTSQAPTNIRVDPGVTQTVQVVAEPASLQVIQIRLHGGLVGLQSAESVRRVLDLGAGGNLLFAVQVPSSGTAAIQVTSAEHLRAAALSLQVVTSSYSPGQQLHLHAAGIAFALADSARRHQPHAPDASSALKDYDLAATEAEAAGDVSLQRWVLAQKARFLLYRKSSFIETGELLQHAVSLAGTDDPAVEALLYKTLSSCRYYLGNLPAAVSDGEHALALYRTTGDVYWQGIVLGNLIADYGELGRVDDAAAAAHEALNDAELTSDTAGVVFSLTELANLAREQGKLQSAFEAFREASVWAQDIHYAPLVQAEIEQALGQFYMDLGLWSEAQNQLRLCLQHAPATSPSALQARGLLARAMDNLGDARGAVHEYNAAIESARSLHLAPEEASLLLGRSAVMLHTHNSALALDDARSAASLADQQKSPALRIDAALAEGSACLAKCTDSTSPTQYFQQALAWIEQSGEREQEAVAYAGLARVDVQQGNDKDALPSIEHALVLMESSRASFASRDLAASFFAERSTWYALAIDIAVRLNRRYPALGFGDMAFRYSERARARAMLDALGDTESNTASSVPPALLRRIAANNYNIEAQKAELLVGSDSEGAAAKLQNLYREQDALAAEERTVQTPAVGQGFHSIAEIQRELLQDDSALISIAEGEHSSYRWLITRSAVRVDVLPSPSELDKRFLPLIKALASRRPHAIAGENATQYAERLQSFHAGLDAKLQQAGELLLPALPRNTRYLYIVAQGSLLTLPWSGLRTKCDGGTCYAVERYTISIEPSASIAVALAQRSPASHASKVLVVSNPTRANSQLNLRWSALGPLPGSRREEQAIAQAAGHNDLRILNGDNATIENVTAELQDNIGVAHFATHTVLVPHHPGLSGIALATSGHSHAMGGSVLWLRDIPQLRAPPLVVLSGCQTQGGNFAGEDLNTLTQAFFYAGAQQVIASSWAVDDDATVSLMGAFYRNMLGKELPAADALRKAQLQAIGSGADLEDWAPFLVDGVPVKRVAGGKATK